MDLVLSALSGKLFSIIMWGYKTRTSLLFLAHSILFSREAISLGKDSLNLWIFKLPDPASDTLDMRFYLHENLTYFPFSNNENLSQQGGGCLLKQTATENLWTGWRMALRKAGSYTCRLGLLWPTRKNLSWGWQTWESSLETWHRQHWPPEAGASPVYHWSK